MTFILLFVFSLLLQGTLGEIVCEELPLEMCTFSIASSGNRCLLENYIKNNGNIEYQCKTSDIIVKNMKEWIESDKCISACGIDRKSVGISSDSLIEPSFTAKLCSPSCFDNCPNIVDLYYNLAIGEGLFLSNLCEMQKHMPRRAMSQLQSSKVALGPASEADGPIFAAEAPFSSDKSKFIVSAPISI